MNLYLIGHDYRYAAEQMLLTLFPDERPVYPDGRLERHIDPKYPTEYIANIDRICAAKAKLEAFFL